MPVLQQARLRKHLLASGLHVMEIGVGNGASGDAHHVPSGSNVIPHQPHRFSHKPTHAIAFDRVADAFAGGEAESTVREIIGQDHQDQQPVLVAASLTPNLLKAFFIPETKLPAHGIRQVA